MPKRAAQGRKAKSWVATHWTGTAVAYEVTFADLWLFHPRDIDRMTLAEFARFRADADTRIKEVNRKVG